MMRTCLLVALLATLTACATETRVIHDNSATAKFANLMNGEGNAGGETVSGGWAVQRGGVTVDPSGKPPTEMQLRIAELLRKQRENPQPVPQDNPAGIHITTSNDPPSSSSTTTMPASLNPFGGPSR